MLNGPVRGSDPPEPELDRPEPEPMVRFEVQQNPEPDPKSSSRFSKIPREPDRTGLRQPYCVNSTRVREGSRQDIRMSGHAWMSFAALFSRSSLSSRGGGGSYTGLRPSVNEHRIARRRIKSNDRCRRAVEMPLICHLRSAFASRMYRALPFLATRSLIVNPPRAL